jgi:hypothetical protein
MKALNAKIAAATLAVAATFAGAAQAEECAATQFNAADIAKTLFSSPVSDWNQPAIEALGATTVSNLATQAVRVIGADTKEAQRTFDQIARRTAKGQNVDWDKAKNDIHPAALPALEAAEGGADLESSKQSAIEALAAYQEEAVTTLGTLTAKETPCLVVKGGVALTPAVPKP